MRNLEGEAGEHYLSSREVPIISPTQSFSLLICKRQGIQQLATRSTDDALRSFEGVLAERPTNVIALLGKVCIAVFRFRVTCSRFAVGQDSLCSTKLSTSAQDFPAGLAIETAQST